MIRDGESSPSPGPGSGLPAPDAPPGFFGDYWIVGEIAAGGMGIVYEARQMSMNRRVAVKMIRSGHLATPEERARFRREAEGAGRLNHPNIVPIYEIGEHAGRLYYSMRRIDGDNLATLLRTTLRMPPPNASSEDHRRHQRRIADLLSVVARAVGFAHTNSILHRDLKPANILVDASGQPHLTDFGVAKLLDEQTGLTETRSILGTPAYLAPEILVEGPQRASTATDIYSLGAILFEALTGTPWVDGRTTLAVLQQTLRKASPDPCDLNARLAPDLAAVCTRCLEGEPERRYRSADELADDLRRWLDGRPTHARRPNLATRALRRVGKPGPILAVTGAVVVLVLFVVGPAWFTSGPIDEAAVLRSRPDASRPSGPRPSPMVRGLRRQFFVDIDGSSLSGLTNATTFPWEAHTEDVVAGTESALPGSDSGQRLSGWLLPPSTGDYLFFLAASPRAEVRLGADDTTARMRTLVYEPDSNLPRNWQGQQRTGERSGWVAPRRSGFVSLEAGKRYRLEILHAQGTGDPGFVALAWQRPGDPEPTNGSPPVPAEYLAPDTPEPAPVILLQPRDQTVVEGESTAVRIRAVGTAPLRFRWYRDGLLLPSATNALLRLPQVDPFVAGSYQAVVSDASDSVTSRVAVLRLARLPDEIRPGLRRQVYRSTPGVFVVDLSQAPVYPQEADLDDRVELFETKLEEEWIGQRFSGWLVPPESGDYIFHLAADDTAELRLSTDASPLNLRLLVETPPWSLPRNWRGLKPAPDFDYQPARTSGPVRLEAGRSYFVEALHKQGTVGCYLGVAWTLPGRPPPENGSPPIGSPHLLGLGIDRAAAPVDGTRPTPSSASPP